MQTAKVDAQRIAQYAYRFRDQMRLWEPPRAIIQKLAFLSATRQRLNQAYNLLAVPITEQETFISKSLQKTLKGNVKKSLMAIQDFYDSCNCGWIKIFIFFSAMDTGKNPMNQPHGRPRYCKRY